MDDDKPTIAVDVVTLIEQYEKGRLIALGQAEAATDPHRRAHYDGVANTFEALAETLRAMRARAEVELAERSAAEQAQARAQRRSRREVLLNAALRGMCLAHVAVGPVVTLFLVLFAHAQGKPLGYVIAGLMACGVGVAAWVLRRVR